MSPIFKIGQIFTKSTQHLLQRLSTKTMLNSSSPSRAVAVDHSPLDQRLVWFDGEMTGLDVEKDLYLEVACIVTTSDLKVIAEGPNIVIHQPKHVLDGMDEWCTNTHTKSGLYKASLESKISVEEAEQQLLSFVRPLTAKGKCSVAGNSIYMDMIFLRKYMPNFVNHFHYRVVDVSSIKTISKLWYGSSYEGKTCTHRALDDIHESIHELQHYRENLFKPPK